MSSIYQTLTYTISTPINIHMPKLLLVFMSLVALSLPVVAAMGLTLLEQLL
jgi:hypothetical protein